MTLSTTALFAKDPQPTLILDAAARLLSANPAFEALALGRSPATVLPSNYAALIQACLFQDRAIAEVEAQVGERILLWTLIPSDDCRQVIARCRDATAEDRKSVV